MSTRAFFRHYCLFTQRQGPHTFSTDKHCTCTGLLGFGLILINTLVLTFFGATDPNITEATSSEIQLTTLDKLLLLTLARVVTVKWRVQYHCLHYYNIIIAMIV